MHVIKGPLCVIFNKSSKSGVFPDLMKMAKVLPLFKANDSKLLGNYRPISLLPVISKVLEKIVYKWTVQHLEQHNALYSRQFGFHKGHSTTDDVANFVRECLNGFEND